MLARTPIDSNAAEIRPPVDDSAIPIISLRCFSPAPIFSA
jgi:hypothetical protein